MGDIFRFFVLIKCFATSFSCRNNISAFDGLPEEILVKIFGQLGFATRRTILPLVCKTWQQFTQHSPYLWAEVTISGPEETGALAILQRSGQTGGICDAAASAVRWPPVVHWFQNHPSAAVSSLRLGNPRNRTGDPELGLSVRSGNFRNLLIGLRGTLEHLNVTDFDLISTRPGDCELGWLSKLKTLHLVFRPDNYGNVRFDIHTADLAVIARVKSLESIVLEGNSYMATQAFPPAFFELPQLKQLTLVHITSGFAAGLGRLTGLTSLTIYSIGGIDFAAEVARQAATLPGLVILDLSGNLGLSELPDLSAMRALRALRCGGCGFETLPVERLRALPAVEELDFDNCPLMHMSENVDELSVLRTLRVLSVYQCKMSGAGTRAMMRFQSAVLGRSPGLRVVVEPPPQPSLSWSEMFTVAGPRPVENLPVGGRQELRIHV